MYTNKRMLIDIYPGNICLVVEDYIYLAVPGTDSVLLIWSTNIKTRSSTSRNLQSVAETDKANATLRNSEMDVHVGS